MASRGTAQFSLVARWGTGHFLWWRVGELDFFSGGEWGNWAIFSGGEQGTAHFFLWWCVGELTFFSGREYVELEIFSLVASRGTAQFFSLVARWGAGLSGGE